MYRKQTVAVGSFPANVFGLHDVHGNVWEWVEDCWNGSYGGAPRNCFGRVLRGGSWLNGPRQLRAANRDWNLAGQLGSHLGFRIARTLP